MIKELVSKLLRGYDDGVVAATAFNRMREENLEEFGKVAYSDLQEFFKEFVSADERVTVEERNRGFWVVFKGEHLFRAAVCVYTDRAEVQVDRVPIVRYDGIDAEDIEEYMQDPYLDVHASILKAFGKYVREYLKKEIKRL